MIRINLLPTKKTKKAVVVEKQLLYIIAGVIALAAILGFWWVSLNMKTASLKEEKIHVQAMAEDLKKKIQEVENFEKDKKVYEEKIAIIEGLKKRQDLPVHMLDELSKAIPDGLWLSRFTEQSSAINIEGVAFSNDEIVTFVNNLKASTMFQDVVLGESVLSTGTPATYSFKLSMKLKS